MRQSILVGGAFSGILLTSTCGPDSDASSTSSSLFSVWRKEDVGAVNGLAPGPWSLAEMLDSLIFSAAITSGSGIIFLAAIDCETGVKPGTSLGHSNSAPFRFRGLGEMK